MATLTGVEAHYTSTYVHSRPTLVHEASTHSHELTTQGYWVSTTRLHQHPQSGHVKAPCRPTHLHRLATKRHGKPRGPPGTPTMSLAWTSANTGGNPRVWVVDWDGGP
ncbi:MAG: hypothetical protein IKQ20_03655 [Bacteroidales bacterium]|nr:hypothetical protein [Bacteroidales bacterium]